MAHLTVRMCELRRQRDDLNSQLIDLEEEDMPDPLVEEGDLKGMAKLFRETVKTTEDPKKLRHFFSSFIEQIIVTDDGVRIEYRADKLVNLSGFDSVRSKVTWLPDQGSNLGSAD